MSSDSESSITDSTLEDEGRDEDRISSKVLKQDAPFWTSSQLQVLHPFKEEWFLASGDDKKRILQRALDKLAGVSPEVDEEQLKPKVVRWLRRKVSKRAKCGPGGKIPSLRTILFWYKGDYFAKLVEERYPQEAGTKQFTKPNVGAMSTVAAEYMRKLETDPTMASEKETYEKLRLDWAKNGAPKNRRNAMASKKASSMISKFAVELYFSTGMRIVVLGGHKNENNTVKYGCYDFNPQIGKNAKTKFEQTYEGWEEVMTGFVEYCKDNVSGTEGDDEGSEEDEEEGIAIRKGLRRKPKVDLEKNEYGEPQLPKDCLRTAGDKNKDLDRKKDILRSWLMGYYNLAKASRGARVPWKMITDEPDKFYDPGFMPPDIQIRDPSKMVKEQIEACFKLWKKKEATGNQPFQFQQVYSSTRGFETGRGRRIFDSDDSEGEDRLPGGRRHPGRYRYRSPKQPSPAISVFESSDSNDNRNANNKRITTAEEESTSSGNRSVAELHSKRRAKKGKDDNTKKRERSRKKGPEKDAAKKKIIRDPKQQHPRTVAPQLNPPTHRDERQNRDKSGEENDSDKEANGVSGPGSFGSHPGLELEGPEWDPNIDPALRDLHHPRTFPTHGPNDPVPDGYIPTPAVTSQFVDVVNPPVEKSSRKGKGAKKAAPQVVAPVLTRSQARLLKKAEAANDGIDHPRKRKLFALDNEDTEEGLEGRKRKESGPRGKAAGSKGEGPGNKRQKTLPGASGDLPDQSIKRAADSRRYKQTGAKATESPRKRKAGPSEEPANTSGGVKNSKVELRKPVPKPRPLKGKAGKTNSGGGI